MTLKLHDADDIRAALQGTARAFEAGRPGVSEAMTDLVALGFYAALDAVGLAFDVGDWRLCDDTGT